MHQPPVVDRVLLARLANLARLHVPREREPWLLEQLERIVVAFSTLQHAAPVKNEFPLDPPSALRPDLPEAPMAVADVLANAPAQAAQCFLVPRVVDG